jgi:uncharacterized protein
VCKLDPDQPIPESIKMSPLRSATRTSKELSVVVTEKYIPADSEAKKNWRCMEINDPIDIALSGILASFAIPLAQAGVPIFILSTFKTSYLFVQNTDLASAIKTLSNYVEIKLAE